MRTSLLKFTFSASSAYRPQFQWQCQRILLMLSAYTVFVNFALHTKQKLSCGAKLLHMKTFATQAIMSRDKYGIWWSGYILRLRLMWQSRGSKNTFLNKCAFSDYSCSIKQKFGRGLSDLATFLYFYTMLQQRPIWVLNWLKSCTSSTGKEEPLM